MRSFRLEFEHDNISESRQIEFESDDAAPAFFILEREGEGAATLSEDGRRLGVLRRSHTGYWQFGR